jgi:hypothetical protein
MKYAIGLAALFMAVVFSSGQTTQPTWSEMLASASDHARIVATTQPTLLTTQQVDQLIAENAALKEEVATLKIQLAGLRSPGFSPDTSRNAAAPATQPVPKIASTTDDHQPGQTYTGPRGGVYHYTASGNKVYQRHK